MIYRTAALIDDIYYLARRMPAGDMKSAPPVGMRERAARRAARSHIRDTDARYYRHAGFYFSQQQRSSSAQPVVQVYDRIPRPPEYRQKAAPRTSSPFRLKKCRPRTQVL